MPILVDKPLRYLERKGADWHRFNRADEDDGQLDLYGEYPQNLITLSHVTRRTAEDVICVYVGSTAEVAIYWHWSEHANVQFNNLAAYQGYDYSDFVDVMAELGYGLDSQMMTDVTRELQEMVTSARQQAGLLIPN